MECRPLRAEDDRSKFASGDPDLDRFFHQYAGQNQFKHHLGVSYVAVEGNRILGYVTVAPAQVEIDSLPTGARSRLPRYPLPVLRLARLAVDRTATGVGIGAELLRHTFVLAVRMSETIGCIGVVVDSKPGAAGFYAKFGFVALEVVEGSSAARPVPVAMILPLRSVALAMKAKGGNGR